MPLILLAAFIGVPILEIALFIEVGGRIGVGPTVAIVILTAMAGTALLRAQGLGTLGRARAALEAGRFPAHEMFDGACLLVAGVLLLTPGFATDGIGLALFIPGLRAAIRVWLGALLVRRGHLQASVFDAGDDAGPGHPPRGPGTPGGAGRPGGPVIDGDFEVVEAEDEGKTSGRPPHSGPRSSPRLRPHGDASERHPGSR